MERGEATKIGKVSKRGKEDRTQIVALREPRQKEDVGNKTGERH